MAQERLAQHYVVEILARSRTLQNRCEDLLDIHYISSAPRQLARTIGKVAGYIARAAVNIYKDIDWTAAPEDIEHDLHLLRGADAHIQYLAQQLRYVEGAKAQRVPWSIIPSFEGFVTKFLPDVQVMLRAMWHYNYSFHLSDLRGFYRTLLSEYPDYLPDEDLDKDVLGELKTAFHLVSFPYLEQKHILLHSLLGHEVGHLIVDEFITKQREDEFAAAVVADIKDITDVQLSGLPVGEDGNLKRIAEQVLARNIRTATTFWRRALEELLSDTVGAFLFGPAALFSTLDMALQDGYDIRPEEKTNYYPPWRYRLRRVLRIVDAQGIWFPVPSALFADQVDRSARVAEHVQAIRDIVGITSDHDEIAADPIAKLVYSGIEDHLVQGEKYLLEDRSLQNHRPNPKHIYRRLPTLINRLDNRIPPNAFEQSLEDDRLPEFVEIINAAWFYKVSLGPIDIAIPSSIEAAIKVRNRTNNLVLKAIEYAHLVGEYSDWAKNNLEKDGKSDSAAASPESAGVLTRDQIISWMQKPELEGRLIVTPLLNRDESIGPSSIDVRLGNQFLVFKRESFPLLDVGNPEGLTPRMGRFQERLVLPLREKFVLHPGQLVIGSTLEYVQLPPRLMCYVVGKSGWGRMGLIIATATKVDPGFQGCITLEIINEGEVPLILYPGLPIAQLVLHPAVGMARYSGGYECPIGPEFPKLTPPDRRWGFWTSTKNPPSAPSK